MFHWIYYCITVYDDANRTFKCFTSNKHTLKLLILLGSRPLILPLSNTALAATKRIKRKLYGDPANDGNVSVQQLKAADMKSVALFHYFDVCRTTGDLFDAFKFNFFILSRQH